MNLVIAGGGTGGHIFAGVAIAQEFKSQSQANQVLFVGSEYGLEKKLVPKSGFALQTIKVGKLVGQNIFRRILTLLQIPIAVVRCVLILRKFKADMVIGVGGFAAGPCILAGRILGLPIGVLEQNSVMGFTNRLSAAMAHHVFLAFDDIPVGVSQEKCVFSGNPTRSQLGYREKADKDFVIFAFGGSQGATGINKMLTEAAAKLLPLKHEIQIIHQTGEKDFDWVATAYKNIGFPAQVHRFIDDMQSMYDKASLVVCRSGSSTISELGATRNAAVFIPFPFAAQNHQERNARVVEASGAARVLLQTENDGDKLAEVILELRADRERLRRMREAMAAFYQPNAAKKIVDVMKAHSLIGRRS